MSEKLVWHFPDCTNLDYIDFKDKNAVTRLLIEQHLEKTNSMFEWKGLPDTIPQHYLEFLLQTVGYAGIIKEKDKLFATYGNVGGIRNYNYEPTALIVSNPYLLIESKAYRIFYGKDSDIDSPLKGAIKTNGDCVVIANDMLSKGLLPMSRFYASQLVENTITKNITTIVARAMYILAVGDEDIREDFEDLIDNLIDGEIKALLAEGILGDGAKELVQTLPFADDIHKAITDFIENEQYIRSMWLNEHGLQSNYNMKRESLNSNESQLNKDAVIPYPDTMLKMRRLACKRINELYGVNWSVDFNSAWKYSRQGIEESLEAIDEETEMTTNSSQNDEEKEMPTNSSQKDGEENEEETEIS